MSAFAPGSCSAPIRTAALPLFTKPNPLALGSRLGYRYLAMKCRGGLWPPAGETHRQRVCRGGLWPPAGMRHR